MIKMRLCLLVLFEFSSCLGQLTNLHLVSEWKELEYDFSSNEDKQAALNSGAYVPGNGVPIDVAVHYSKSSGRYQYVIFIQEF